MQDSRQPGGKPAWLYPEDRCCDEWAPEDGCPYHTGKPAMSLAARQFVAETEARQ
jgi:hypothetical protein